MERGSNRTGSKWNVDQTGQDQNGTWIKQDGNKMEHEPNGTEEKRNGE